ncbi:MAG: hypothetical protein HYT94_05405 [Parcubacteria group bacterium]|nr:hypothetical protein [Parcubacteria group bacterium]
MKFQLCTCGYPPFIHGHFFDENGPYLSGKGLEHLSDNFFCQEEAWSFIQEAFGFGKITESEAKMLKKDAVLLALPFKLPPDVEEYKKQTPESDAKLL